MLKTKRNLEQLESFADRTVMTEPPRQIDKEKLSELRSQMEAALAKAKANNTPRILRQPRIDANKSESRRWLDEEVYKVADRMMNAPPAPLPVPPAANHQPPLPGTHSNGDTTSATSDKELHELLRDVRKKLYGKTEC